MEKQFSFIKDLDKSSKQVKLIVRVMRLWEVVNLYNDMKMSFDMILMDEKGDQIHASIKHELFKSVDDILQEGTILYVDDFKVEDKAKSFRPIDYKFKVTFDEKAIIKATEGEFLFPPQRFTFLDFKDISSKLNDKGDLIDVIGFWCNIGELQNRNTKMGTTSLRDIHIADNDGNMMRIAFWGAMVKQIPDVTLDVEPQFVIIVTSTYVRTYEGGYHLQVSQATKVYLNLDIEEVTAFRNSGSKPPHKMIQPRKRLPPTFDKQRTDNNTTIKEIMSAVRDVTSKDFFTCNAIITKLHKSRGWYYTSCQSCLKVVKKKEDGYWCFSCRNFVDHVGRFKIQFEIEDDTGAIDVTVFTDTAEELIGRTFASMIDLINEGGDEEAIYEIMENTMLGKRKTFSLKISKYNRENPMSSLTATKIVTDGTNAKRGKTVES